MEIQAKFRAVPRQGYITQGASNGARECGLREKDILECLESLSLNSFHKSMLATNEEAAAQGLWQDVYRPDFRGMRLYMKVQIRPNGQATIIQFKK